MSYSNHDSYGLCKQCFKQHAFCTCEVNNRETTELTDQTFSEHNPQCQSIGEQEQEQKQEQGGLEQEQGPQIQGQNQEGQTQGPQEQKQGDQSQGPQTQEQNEIQVQTQDQDQNQTEDQDQTQGPQLQAQRHGDQTMTNDQSISTPVDVDGVNVDVKCGDCKPIIIFDDDFFEKQKKRKHGNKGGEDVGNDHCKNRRCTKDCDCCVQNLGDLLKEVRTFQSTDPSTKPIDIFFNTVNGLPNPSTGQVITQVEDCSILRFKLSTQATAAPNTAVQLCDVAGICSTADPVIDFLVEKANEVEDESDQSCDKKKKSCTCSCCATGIGDELQFTANYGLELDVYIKGQLSTSTEGESLYVLAVKDCLVYLVDDLTTPGRVCVFSLCAISGFTVVDQTIGTG